MEKPKYVLSHARQPVKSLATRTIYTTEGKYEKEWLRTRFNTPASHQLVLHQMVLHTDAIVLPLAFQKTLAIFHTEPIHAREDSILRKAGGILNIIDIIRLCWLQTSRAII